MRILRFVPLLLALLLAAPIPTAAWKLRKKQHASTTTDDDSGSTTSDMTRPRTRPVRAPHNVTITQVENGVVVNATLPSECLPVEQRCLDDELTPLVDMAHNDTASAEEKNVALQSFCASECGQK
jgi:hypothetical protein